MHHATGFEGPMVFDCDESNCRELSEEELWGPPTPEDEETFPPDEETWR